MRVKAHIYSDDRFYDLKDVDVTAYFEDEGRTLEHMVKLCQYGMRNDYSADEIALYMEPHVEEIAELFDYLRRFEFQKDPPGYEVVVDVGTAFGWIAEKRLEWLEPCARALATFA